MSSERIRANLLGSTALALGLAFAGAALAAPAAPNAGQILQQQTGMSPGGPLPDYDLTFGGKKLGPAPSGGAVVQLTKVEIEGNTLFPSGVLLKELGNFTAAPLDFAGLSALADKIADYYRQNNFPFTKALLPPQDLTSGVLRIQVIEGTYGNIKVVGDPKLSPGGAPYLHQLKSGDFIEADRLERAMLILNDQPGIRAIPTIRPGDNLSAGDLTVKVVRDKGVEGSVSFDNWGSRTTGRHRLSVQGAADSLLLWGDQVSGTMTVTDGQMVTSQIGYDVALNRDGLRGGMSVSRTTYQLQDEFAPLEATGRADVIDIHASIPAIRSVKVNLTPNISLQKKIFEDKFGVLEREAADQDKSSIVATAGAYFDWRDQFLGGAMTYGSASFSYGRLTLDEGLLQNDQAPAGSHTAGDWAKAVFNIARMQQLPLGFVGFARYSGQWASKNLDSSEGFSLGGPEQVRAYPLGEAPGDAGHMVQVELRRPLDNGLAPFIFYDAGLVTIERNPNDGSLLENERFLSGAGLGINAQWGPLSGSATVAWPIKGGDPMSDIEWDKPAIWAKLAATY